VEESSIESAKAGSAICIADYESLEQLTMDLSIMPGAGIANIEIVPISENNCATDIRQYLQIHS
jgi:hypothetical protein